MAKPQQPTNYTFNVAAKTITLTDYTTLRLDRLALITDTTINKVIYNFADNSVTSATVAGNVITLNVLPVECNNTDKLRIDYTNHGTDPVQDPDPATLSDRISGENPDLDALRVISIGDDYANESPLVGDIIAPMDVSAYSSVSVFVSNTWTGTVQWQVTNDPTQTTWFNLLLAPVNGAPGKDVASTAANGQWSGSLRGARYFKVARTAATGGTATVRATMHSLPVDSPSKNVAGEGESVPTPIGYTGMRDISGNILGFRTAEQDNVIVGMLRTQAYIFNGTQSDRPMNVTAANSSATGKGIQAAGALGWDAVNSIYKRVTVDTSGNWYVSPSAVLASPIPTTAQLIAMRDASGNLLEFREASADNITTGAIRSYNYIFNGTQGDRPKTGVAALGSTDGKGIQGVAPMYYNGTSWQYATASTPMPVANTSTTLPANAAQETGGNLATLVTRTPALGQAAMAASSPVVIASDQSAIPINSAGATGAAVPSRANAMGIQDQTGNLVIPRTAEVDNVSVRLLGMLPYAYNVAATTSNRTMDVSSAQGTTDGKGIQAVGLIGWDGANYQRAKTDTSGNLVSRMASTTVTLHTSGAETTTGNGTNFTVGQFQEAIVMLSCTAASGTTPTLNAKLQTFDGSVWYDIPDSAFTQLTGTGSQAIKVNTFGSIMRVVWTLGGTTPSFTFSVIGIFK